MNESEISSPAPVELTDQIAALRRQMTTLLLALIVVSGTLTVYLSYQSHVVGKEIDAVRPQALQVMKVFNQASLVVGKLLPQLVAYGQAHPDFQPILKKHGIPLTNPVAPNPAVKK